MPVLTVSGFCASFWNSPYAKPASHSPHKCSVLSFQSPVIRALSDHGAVSVHLEIGCLTGPILSLESGSISSSMQICSRTLTYTGRGIPREAKSANAPDLGVVDRSLGSPPGAPVEHDSPLVPPAQNWCELARWCWLGRIRLSARTEGHNALEADMHEDAQGDGNNPSSLATRELHTMLDCSWLWVIGGKLLMATSAALCEPAAYECLPVH